MPKPQQDRDFPEVEAREWFMFVLPWDRVDRVPRERKRLTLCGYGRAEWCLDKSFY
jgi:hypothetical protein